MPGLLDPKRLTRADKAPSSPAATTGATQGNRFGVPSVESMASTSGMSTGSPANALEKTTRSAAGLATPRVSGTGGAPAITPATGRPGQRSLPGVSGRLRGLLREGSPLLDLARSNAMRAANRRGLMNSSIAAGAGEEAAILTALPIAQGDASIAAGERGLESQEFMQGRGIASQEKMQERQIASTERVAAAERKLQDLINQRNIRSQELMQERGLAHDAAQRQAQREMQSSIAAAQREHEAALADQRAETERQTLDTSKAVAHQQAITRIEDSYNRRVGTIDANANIPAETANKLKAAAKRDYDRARSAADQVAGTETKWVKGAYEGTVDEEAE